MAHKKGQGSSRNGRDSNPQMRGIKAYAGEKVQSGSIIVRQVGTRVHPGANVAMGRDFTIFASVPGTVKFRSGRRVIVSVEPSAVDPALAQVNAN